MSAEPAVPIATAGLTDVLLSSRYRLDDALGGGPAGHVYAAHDVLLDRAVAVKVLDALGEEVGVGRAVRAARAAARARGARLIDVLDVEYGRPSFVVLGLVAAAPLPIAAPDGLGVHRAVTVAEDVLSALAALHQVGAVHRDVRPENVLLGEDGRAWLTSAGLGEAARDQGLGLRIGADPQRRRAPAPSPEQDLGVPATARSDVAAAGALLGVLLAGRGGPSVDQVLRRATSQDPDARHRDATELLQALRDALATPHPRAVTPPSPPPAPPAAQAPRTPAPSTPAASAPAAAPPPPAIATPATAAPMPAPYAPAVPAARTAPGPRTSGPAAPVRAGATAAAVAVDEVAAGPAAGAAEAGHDAVDASGPAAPEDYLLTVPVEAHVPRLVSRLTLSAAAIAAAWLLVGVPIANLGAEEAAPALAADSELLPADDPADASVVVGRDGLVAPAALPPQDLSAVLALAAGQGDLGPQTDELLGRLQRLDALRGIAREAEAATLYGSAAVDAQSANASAQVSTAVADLLRPEVTLDGLAAVVDLDPAAAGTLGRTFATRVRVLTALEGEARREEAFALWLLSQQGVADGTLTPAFDAAARAALEGIVGET